MGYSKVDQEIIGKIKGIVEDPKRVLTEQRDLASYSFDASFGIYYPELVVQPLATIEVAEIVKLAFLHNIPIYPRGQSTSLS
ncbi:MAG: glycolate oxidase subunit GlcD, partial [Bacilli bacterium]